MRPDTAGDDTMMWPFGIVIGFPVSVSKRKLETSKADMLVKGV
jgi:hypothetical protein